MLDDVNHVLARTKNQEAEFGNWARGGGQAILKSMIDT